MGDWKAGCVACAVAEVDARMRVSAASVFSMG